MSALGQKQTFALQNGMSALPPNSGHVRCNSGCPLCANSGHSANRSITSLAREQHGRYGEAERLGSLEIDDELVLYWCLHWQIGRLLVLDDAVNVAGRAAVLVEDIAQGYKCPTPTTLRIFNCAERLP